jgi:iron(II)-dependent oxidoreductase
MDSTTTMRAAMRNGTDPTTKINWMGFRCAKSTGEGPVASGERKEDVVHSPLAFRR